MERHALLLLIASACATPTPLPVVAPTAVVACPPAPPTSTWRDRVTLPPALPPAASSRADLEPPMRAAPMAAGCDRSDGREPRVGWPPECIYPSAALFWRWPGNLVWVPTEAGLGRCHNEEVIFPAASPECGEPRIASVAEDGTLHYPGAADDGSATVVHLGHATTAGRVTEASLREAERVMGPRAALLLHVTEDGFSPASLAPLADRLVALRVVLFGSYETHRPLDLSDLPTMPHLRTLSVASDVPVHGLASLTRHEELRGLDLHAELPEVERRAIRQLTRLTHLAVHGDVASELPTLRSLVWLSVAATHRNLRAAARLRYLEALVLGPIERDALRHLRLMPRLETLSVPLGPLLDVSSLTRRTSLRTLVVRARGAPEGSIERWLARAEPLTQMPRTALVLDIDEGLPETTHLGPWHPVACRAVGATCDPDAPPPEPPAPDPTAEEVDRLLE